MHHPKWHPTIHVSHEKNEIKIKIPWNMKLVNYEPDSHHERFEYSLVPRLGFHPLLSPLDQPHLQEASNRFQ